MAIKLTDCKQISSIDCNDLKEPKFRAQTVLNSENEYWTVHESEGELYKVLHKKQCYAY